MTRYSKEYFSDDELKCKCGCGVVLLDPVFDVELTRLRIKMNDKIGSNSCCRCAKHNAAVGGVPNSFHIYDKPKWKNLKGTAAIDVPFTKLFYRNKLARVAWQSGWRIGLSKNFLHLDCGAIMGYVKQSIFHYSNHGVSEEDLQKFKSIIINNGASNA